MTNSYIKGPEYYNKFKNRLEKDKLREITLREQAAATGLTCPEVKAKSKLKVIKIRKINL